MFRETNRVYRQLNIAFDALTTALAYYISTGAAGYIFSGEFRFPKYARGQEWIFYLVVILWPLLLNINGLYPTNRLRAFSQTARIIAKTSLHGLAIILILLFLLKSHSVGRVILVYFTVLAAIFLMIKEEAARLLFKYLRTSGGNIRNVLVVGEPGSISYVIKKLEKDDSLGLKLAGILIPDSNKAKENLSGQRVLGTFSDIDKVLSANVIDNVIITNYIWPYYREIENIIASCEGEGVEVWLPARIFHTKIVKPEGDEFMDIPMFVFRTEPKFSWELLSKIVLDRVSGLALGILSLPVIAIAAVFIKLTSSGPVIFKQERCGYHGRRFTLYKLRTMYADAETTKAELAGLNTMTGPIFKMDRDPRITPVGRFLRKMSIDELPQFWNVLEGSMSLVGPRPPIPEEVAKYKGWQRRRLSMKPGITGLLQVSGRSDIKDFNAWVDMDLDYIDNWSLWLDTKIVFKTFFVVLSMRGAK